MTIQHKIRKDGDGNTKIVRLTPLNAIRAFCLECVCWSSDEVKNCTNPLCPLYPFRFGKNPSRKGIGGDTRKAKAKLKERYTKNGN